MMASAPYARLPSENSKSSNSEARSITTVLSVESQYVMTAHSIKSNSAFRMKLTIELAVAVTARCKMKL